MRQHHRSHRAREVLPFGSLSVMPPLAENLNTMVDDIRREIGQVSDECITHTPTPPHLVRFG